MRIINKYLFSSILLVVSILSLMVNWQAELVYLLTGVLLIWVLAKLGSGLVLRESTAFLYSITCLLMPLIGYQYYTSANKLARIWVKFMPISEDVYFNYALPAISFFCFAITIPINGEKDRDPYFKKQLTAIKSKLASGNLQGIWILVTGIIVSFVTKYLPTGLQFFSTLFFFASFAGLLYIFYSPKFKNKAWLILLFAFFLVNNALATGMFTIVAYMGVTIFSFFFYGKKVSLLRKLTFVVIAFLSIMALQNTKKIFRQYTWTSEYQGNRAILFADLFIENLQKGSSLLQNEVFFPVYSRLNQGYNVALVMNRYPNYKEFDGGERLSTVFLSAFVPRFLWPDKPQAGGVFNMEYYAGFRIGGWSTNVGPLGEAYGSFGRTGGILYMFFVGMFIRWVYGKVFSYSKKTPLLICWIPLLFYQITYSAETDSLAIINSIVKSVFFIWILYKIMPAWFGVERRLLKRKTIQPAEVTPATLRVS